MLFRSHSQPAKTVAGARGEAGDNARLLTISTGLWSDVFDGGTPASAPAVPQDFPFDIVGSTANLVSISGRVLTSDGRGLRNATVSITNSNGVNRIATTSSFGFFSFDNVSAGGAYTFRIFSRFFRFQPRTVQIDGNLTLADFLGLE